MNPTRKMKPGWEERIEGWKKKLQQANVPKKRKTLLHMCRWKDKNKTVEDKSDNETWSDKSTQIAKRQKD